MKSVPLTAFPRGVTRRAGVKRLRASGRIPAVVYGGRNAAENLELRQTDIENLIHHSASENVLVDLEVTNAARPKRLALVQEIQHHPLTGQVLHVDLHEVKEDEKVIIMVPVEPLGEAQGVKNGGVLEHVLFKLRVRALPKDLPETISVDVSHLDIGQAVHLGEIQPPPGVELMGDKSLSVIACAAPLTEAQEAAAAEAEAVAAGDVEMIKEKKEEGEAGAAPAKAAAAPAAKGAATAEKAAAPEKAAEKAPEKKPKK